MGEVGGAAMVYVDCEPASKSRVDGQANVDLNSIRSHRCPIA
jgi:hypothetical protein